jgi:hypothetical protein
MLLQIWKDSDIFLGNTVSVVLIVELFTVQTLNFGIRLMFEFVFCDVFCHP